MATFTQFKHFPTEVRLIIWRHALEKESSSRIILVHKKTPRIMPSKLLISPFLLTSHESRICAKGFYNVQVDLYALPPITPDLVDFSFQQWRDDTDFWDNCGNAATCEAADAILRHVPGASTNTQRGCLFFNPAWDRFATSFDCRPEPIGHDRDYFWFDEYHRDKYALEYYDAEAESHAATWSGNGIDTDV
ncbi:hypothetical protein PG994_012742 [Apiospora phragmitis]|uniref:2EXR domain-containing protein n=1 Tax=Apiospora phragmitis TaxID=2905665 RepID=A0ABR1TBB4_9PEZI